MQKRNTPGSALLLTVMIIAILSTTTLASIAVRFDQLSSTDKVANAAVAKSAADSALTRVKEKIEDGQAITPTIFDLEANSESVKSSGDYRPNPRKIVSTYEKAPSSLPRCLAVGVVIPWTNDGQYLYSSSDSANPAMMFHYANIVNDTPLGVVPGNGGLSADQKSLTVSELTNLGHFYNPFAPSGAKQNDVSYWTIKMGGPFDQFLTRKAADGVSSFYRGLDFLYLPYLPQWQDSGLFTTTPGTGVDRISATELRSRFENLIKDNGFKVWIDASVSDVQLARYGLGDLFVSSDTYRLKWLQSSLWNDAPEADLMTPYRVDDVGAGTLSWTKAAQPLMTPSSNDTGWATSIVKGAKSFSFVRLDASQAAVAFNKNANISGLLYGSTEGLRLNQYITLQLLDKRLQPAPLLNRNQDLGKLYNVRVTKIGPATTSNGVESIPVTFKLADDDFSTPAVSLTPLRYTVGADVEVISVLASPQPTTSKSISNVTITSDADGLDATVTASSTCAYTVGVLTACPAAGDLVSLTKSGSTPVWGKVTKANFDGNGTAITGFVLDKLHRSPLPTREMAYTYYTSGGAPRIAYYGGAVAMNDYDGGYASESNQLWLYDPEQSDPNLAWQYVNAGGTLPGPRAGASMIYDGSNGNDRLIMIGGYYHQSTNYNPSGYDCEQLQVACLYSNRPGLRVAKRVTNDVYALNLSNNTWEKLDYSSGWGKISSGASYTVRLSSSLADRSGLERWDLVAKNAPGANQTLKVDGTASQIVVYPSAAGIAKGDQLYVYGTKTDGNSSYAWAKVNSVDYTTDTVNLTTYGYKPNSGETQVVFSAVALQVLSRASQTNTCTGGIDPGSFYYCQLTGNDTTGYSVGDQVVLEQYSATQLTSTLSGFISYIDAAGKMFFVADERTAAIKDFSDKTTAKVANDSAVAFPTGRYGGTLAIYPTTNDRASYYQGAAKNINDNHRFADLWNVEFKNKGTNPGALSAVWSFQAIDNDTSALGSGSYRFQVIRSNYLYQMASTTTPASNPAILKSGGSWDNNAYWPLEISSSDAGKIVAGAWATLERRAADGSRETFHGIVANTFNNSPGSCGSYSDTKVCFRHNSAYPNDSGFSGNSASVKITMTPSFNTTNQTGGTFAWNAGGGYVTIQGVLSDYGTVPGVGATVMVWREPGTFPLDAYTFRINSRTFNSGSNTFTFYYDKMTATPPSDTFATGQITSSGGTNRIVTIGDFQLNYDTIGAPEWIKDLSTGAWKLRRSGKFTTGSILYRPAARRGGMTASWYDSGTQKSQLFVIGGTLGVYGSLWRQSDAGATTTDTATWDPRFVSASSTGDVPNLFGGSLVVYKSGSNPVRAVYFGGKQKTDLSSNDYGQTIGPFFQGRPDAGTLGDNAFMIAENAASSVTDAAAFTETIKNNLPAGRPNVDNSLSFRGTGLSGGQSVCAYLAQTGCSSKQLLSQLGVLGRLDTSGTNATYGGSTNGQSPVLKQLGSAFLQQNVSGAKASLIMSTSTLSGINLNGRWGQDGYQPYLADTGLTYGRLGSDFGSDKTAAFAAYASINEGGKSGGILVTTTGVGTAVTSVRGGSTGTTGGWYSYCASADVDSSYTCKTGATRYLPHLPDAEDLLFIMNAGQALGSIDSYKVVGYYGGVKHGYIVTTRSGSQPTVTPIVP